MRSERVDSAVEPETPATTPPDLAARLLEIGLAALLILAPLPFGAVGAAGRLALEIGAFVLLAIWAVRAFAKPTPLPTTLARVGIAGLLGLALIQTLPLGSAAVSRLSPMSLEIRDDSRPPAAELLAERRLVGAELDRLESRATLSVDPSATASALRTGAMMAALLLVATTVASVCGVRQLALALLASAAFQGLYGLLVLASSQPRIWHLAKEHYLGSATGTLINRNHFACLLAMSLACGLARILASVEWSRPASRRSRLLQLFDGENSRNLLLGLLLVVGLAGLLASFSRAGIAVGLLALGLTVLAAGRFRRWRVRLVVVSIIVGVAALPLLQIGAERLVGRYEGSAESFLVPGGRGDVWMDTLSIAAAFPFAGSGFGSFAAAYPLFRSPEVRLYYAHAHNDPLQALAEGGGLGLVFLLVLLTPILQSVVRSLGGAKGTLAVGFAAGLTAVLLHSLVDFNFHIPSNAATAAVLAGALQGLPWIRRR